MQNGRVLVLTRELIGAGLLGALIETSGRVPVFPISGESAEAALDRTQPEMVLLDAYHPSAQSESFYALTDAARVRVYVFSPVPPWDDLMALISGQRFVAVVVPRLGETLADSLERVLAG